MVTQKWYINISWVCMYLISNWYLTKVEFEEKEATALRKAPFNSSNLPRQNQVVLAQNTLKYQ
jgi:hypothetical protein